jgi:hypothetical protein
VAEREPRAGEAIEDAAEHETQCMCPGLERPFPGCAPQAFVPGERRKQRGRVGRMKIDDGPQGFRPFPERIERRIVEILPVGVTVDHGTEELEIAHAAFELVRGRAGILHGEMREGAVAVRLPLNFARQEVVCFAGSAHGRRRVALGLNPRPRKAEDGE